MSSVGTFSGKAKAEAAGNISGRKKCSACLGGMILFCRSLGAGEILFQTENRDVRDLFLKLSSHIAGEGAVSVSKRERRTLPKLYLLKIKGEENVSKILNEAGIALSGGERSLLWAKLPGDKNLGSFAAGVFLACGSVVAPEKSYHLEFVAPHERLMRELCGLFEERLGVCGRITARGRASVLYFKESEQIEDLLTFIGAPRSSLELMNVKIYKDIRNRANRATNCVTANLGKQNRSARIQIEAIEKLRAEGGLSRLPDELKELCELRLKYPEASLSELSGLTVPPVSRSGINHRFARILELAGKKETE